MVRPCEACFSMVRRKVQGCAAQAFGAIFRGFTHVLWPAPDGVGGYDVSILPLRGMSRWGIGSEFGTSTEGKRADPVPGGKPPYGGKSIRRRGTHKLTPLRFRTGPIGHVLNKQKFLNGKEKS